MHCNCKWTETVLGLVILIITIWPNLLGVSATWWVTLIAAILLVLHAWSCGCCGMCAHSQMPRSAKKRR